MQLDPIDPETAFELHIADRKPALADATIGAHKSRLGFFVEWCAERDIENLDELTGRKLQQYRLRRRNVGDLTKVSERTQMATLRVFVKWLESVDGVEQDLHKKIRSPDITARENSRDVMLEANDAEELLAYLERYDYASIQHVVATLLWHTMLRRGSIRSLDVVDYDSTEQSLLIRHRPETDTPLKNKQRGERVIAVSNEVCLVLDDWLRERRPNTVDDYGRSPLLTTNHGRVARSTIRTYCYQVTRPCMYGQECPHDRDEGDCEATEADKSSMCPSSVSPHPFRRGAITHYLQNDVPETVVSDRADVTADVIDQHYDQRSQKEKMEQRRGYLDDT